MLQLKNIAKKYPSNSEYTLENINLTIQRGEVVVIVGGSGTGKTTLLNIIGTIDKHFDGEYIVGEMMISNCNQKQIARLRNEFFGFIFQDLMLVEDETVYYNIQIPLLYSKKFKRSEYATRIKEVCKMLEIESLINKKVNLLSGGEKQRVAIARAIVHEPEVVIMDEATNSLDERLTMQIIKYLHQYSSANNKTLIIVTHELERIIIPEYRLLEVKNKQIITL